MSRMGQLNSIFSLHCIIVPILIEASDPNYIYVHPIGVIHHNGRYTIFQ